MLEENLSLKDIAKAIGISPSTVSLVLHDKPGVSSGTRKKVLQLLRTNGHLDKSIDTPEKKNILLFKYTTIGYFPEKNDGFTTVIIDSIEREARNFGFNILVHTCHEGELNKILDMLKSDSLSGIIMLGTEILYNSFGDNFFQKEGIPIVLVDSYAAINDVDSINIDNRYCMYKSLNHLYELGHRKIGYLHSNIATSNFEERAEAFASYSITRGQIFETTKIIPVIPSMKGAYEKINTLIKNEGVLPTAFITDSDTIAFGAMKAFKENGLKIPHDISIIGFDDNAFCKISDPPLTTVRIPADHIGRSAIKLLSERIEDSSFPKMKILVNGELILRETTSSPNNKKPSVR